MFCLIINKAYIKYAVTKQYMDLEHRLSNVDTLFLELKQNCVPNSSKII